MSNICIISDQFANLLLGNKEYGGAETRLSITSKIFFELGHDVYVLSLTRKKDSNKRKNVENILIEMIQYKSNKYLEIMPILYKFIKFVKDRDIKVIIYFGSNPYYGFFSIISKICGIKILFQVSSDRNIQEDLNIKKFENFFFILGIKLSDAIICQTCHQKRILKKTRSLVNKARIIPNPFPKITKKKSKIKYDIIWVGRMIPTKRLDLLYEIILLNPEITFLVIAKESEGYEEQKKWISKLKRHSNVNIKINIDYKDIFNYYRQSKLLLHTSDSEGFPNILLEAFSMGIPVISIYNDPDDVIKKYKLGYVSSSLDKVSINIKKLLEDDILYNNISKNGIKYLKKHSTAHIKKLYSTIFTEIGI